MTVFENADFIKSIRRHFVAIYGRYIHLDDAGNMTGPEINFAFSAFVVAIRGVWCLMTAGHVLQKMEAAAQHPKIELLTCGFGDFFSLEAKVKKPTLFAFDTEQTIHIDRGGVDMGMIPLRPLYHESLKANGVVPLPTAGWLGYTIPRCDHYCLLGLPEEDIEQIAQTETEGSGVSVQLVLVPLEADAVPAVDPNSRIPRFAATLLDGGQLKSVVGMSGGPIIGIRSLAEGGWGYACIAIQGTWDRDKRKVFGTLAGMIVATTEKLLNEGKGEGC